MNKQQFIEELAEELEIEESIDFNTNIKDLDEWDSMTAMGLIGFVSDTFDVTLNADDIEKLTTIESIIERVGVEKFS
jgi:acyl carrier protein